MNEETKKKIEDKFPIVNSLSQKRRDAAIFGYSLAEAEIERLKILIKEGFVLLQQQWKKSLGQIDADWEKFKTDNKL